MVQRGWDTGGNGGGTKATNAKILSNLIGGATRTVRTTRSGGSSSSGSGSSSGSSSGGSYGGGSTRTTSYSTRSSGGGGGGGGGGAVTSSKWTCPSGATLSRESNGSGNLVCRWNHSGAEFQAIPVQTTTPPATTPVTPTKPAPAPTPAPAPAAPPAAVDAAPSAADYLETADEIFAQTPEAMLADMLLKKYGPTANNQLYRQLEPYADAANALFLMANGLNADSGTGDSQLAWMKDYWNTLQTPGKRVNYDAMLKNTFAAPGDNPLGAYLTDGDANEQSGNAMRLLSGAVEGKYSKIVASPIMQQLDLARKRYIGEAARNPDIGTFISYVQKNNPSLVKQLLS